tara:strand:+ start:1050 stop:1154 length:105 start_codon:yes stop_codon:yes gene_type:complete
MGYGDVFIYDMKPKEREDPETYHFSSKGSHLVSN